MISRRTFIHGHVVMYSAFYPLAVIAVSWNHGGLEIKTLSSGLITCQNDSKVCRLSNCRTFITVNTFPENLSKVYSEGKRIISGYYVLTGDFVYGSNAFIPSVAEELSELKSKEGVYAVLGNHDNKELTFDILSKKGIHVLINEHIPLYRKKDYLFIAGVDDLWAGKLNLETTLKGPMINQNFIMPQPGCYRDD